MEVSPVWQALFVYTWDWDVYNHLKTVVSSGIFWTGSFGQPHQTLDKSGGREPWLENYKGLQVVHVNLFIIMLYRKMYIMLLSGLLIFHEAVTP